MTVDTAIAILFICITCGERRRVAVLDDDWRYLWDKGDVIEPTVTFRGQEYYVDEKVSIPLHDPDS